MVDQGTPGESAAGTGAETDPAAPMRREGDAAPSKRALFGPDPWAAPLILGLLAAGLRLFVPGAPWATFLSLAVAFGAVLPMVYRSRNSSGPSRGAWALFAASIVSGSASIILFPWDGVAVVGLVRSVFDAGAYVFGVIGIVLYAHDLDDSEPDAWLDAAVVGIALSLLLLELVIPEWGTLTLPGRPALFPLLVAAVDAVILTTIARFIIRPIAHVSLSGLGLVIGAVLILDATYYATGTDVISRPVYEAMWMIAYGAWGASAVHPDIARLSRGDAVLVPTFQGDIRSAYRAVTLYVAGAGISIGLLLLDVTQRAGLYAPIILAAIAIQTTLAVARSVRIVRRLSRDTTERMAVEVRLRESEERFRRLAEAAPVGIFVADAVGRTMFQNEALTAIAGQALGEVADFGVFIHPDDRASARAVWSAAVTTRGAASVDSRLIRPDDTIAWVHLRVVPLTADDGLASGWIGTVSDVTELKMAIAAAQEREAFFNELIEQSPVGIGVYGIDGAVLGHNPAKRRIRERIGAPLDVADVRSDPFMRQMGQTAAIERAYAGMRLVVDPTAVSAPLAGTLGSTDGERLWLRFHWYPLSDADGRVLAVISFVEDVTQTVESDARERRVGEKLQEAQKLEALGVLAGGIAHDFNNLLVPIIGYVDLALGELPQGSPVAADLEAARVAASRAADLARQMLAYSGRGSFAIGPVALEDLLGEIGDLMGRSIAKGASLHYEFTPGLPAVLADATQLRQVALNLLVNASDALGGKRGDITLRTALVSVSPDDPDLIPGAPAEPGDYVMLEVSDSGGGMSAATRARIFDPFFSTKSVGRGLGLAATMGIVKGHGGAIRVRSVHGEGSTFQVLLRPTGEPVHSPASGTEPPTERVSSGRVLLVDDEPTVRAVGRRILERAGFTVEEAGDGPEAIERFRADPRAFDSVLLDLTLPSQDGLTVMRELRLLRPGLPVVLCSGWSADEVAGSVRSLPNTMFLQKPYQGQALVEALSSVARRASGAGRS